MRYGPVSLTQQRPVSNSRRKASRLGGLRPGRRRCCADSRDARPRCRPAARRSPAAKRGASSRLTRNSMCQPNGAIAVASRRTTSLGNDIPLALVVDQIEAHAADAGVVERADLIRGNVRLDHGDAAQPLPAARQRVEQRAVVGAVDARLHQHRAVDPEHAEQMQIVVERRIRRRVDALLRVGEGIGRTADMGVGIAGAGRQPRARRAGIAIGRGAGGAESGSFAWRRRHYFPMRNESTDRHALAHGARSWC